MASPTPRRLQCASTASARCGRFRRGGRCQWACPPRTQAHARRSVVFIPFPALRDALLLDEHLTPHGGERRPPIVPTYRCTM